MSLPVQNFRLSEVAEAGIGLGGPATGMERTGTPPINVIGECFAFDSRRLDAEAQRREGVGLHLWLLRRAVYGFLEESSLNKAYVCYALQPDVTRVFFCSHQDNWPQKFYEIIAATPAFIESGRDSFSPGYVRPLAYWEPPRTAVALWPRGLRGETEGARVVNMGNATNYFSYPESEHDGGIHVDKTKPDYVCVPQDEKAEFTLGDKTYLHLNRWAACEIDLRLKLDQE